MENTTEFVILKILQLRSFMEIIIKVMKIFKFASFIVSFLASTGAKINPH